MVRAQHTAQQRRLLEVSQFAQQAAVHTVQQLHLWK